MYIVQYNFGRHTMEAKILGILWNLIQVRDTHHSLAQEKEAGQENALAGMS